MPTHQGNTQTDIVIGSSGDSASEHTEFQFTATYSGTGNFQYADLAPGTDRQYSAYEFVVSDPTTGSPLASFAARYKAWIDRGTAKGNKQINIVNNFTPPPNGSTPNWPLAFQTSAERNWSIDTFDNKGNLYAKLAANWRVRTTVSLTTAYVIQTIVDQTDTLLRVHLVFLDGAAVLLDTVVTMLATGDVSGNVTQDPPDVTDAFSP